MFGEIGHFQKINSDFILQILQLLAPHQTKFINTVCGAMETSISSAPSKYLTDTFGDEVIQELDRLNVESS
jgi:hypothetical protein